MKRHDASLMLLLVAAANCRCSLSNDVTGDGASPHGGRTESIQIVEKPSGENSIWKSYCLQLRDFKKDIPGEFAQSPYIIEYKGQSILACPMKRETLVFLTARENDRLELIPLAVRRRPGLFTDQCRRMGLRPVRFVNGAWLRRENGRWSPIIRSPALLRNPPAHLTSFIWNSRGYSRLTSRGASWN